MLERTVPMTKLIDSGDLTNLTSKQAWDKTTYFNAYQKSFKEGEYNLSEQVYTPTGQVIRRYMSGGISVSSAIEISGFNAVNLIKNMPNKVAFPGNEIKEGMLAGSPLELKAKLLLIMNKYNLAKFIEEQENKQNVADFKELIEKIFHELELSPVTGAKEELGQFRKSLSVNKILAESLKNKIDVFIRNDNKLSFTQVSLGFETNIQAANIAFFKYTTIMRFPKNIDIELYKDKNDRWPMVIIYISKDNDGSFKNIAVSLPQVEALAMMNNLTFSQLDILADAMMGAAADEYERLISQEAVKLSFSRAKNNEAAAAGSAVLTESLDKLYEVISKKIIEGLSSLLSSENKITVVEYLRDLRLGDLRLDEIRELPEALKQLFNKTQSLEDNAKISRAIEEVRGLCNSISADQIMVEALAYYGDGSLQDLSIERRNSSFSADIKVGQTTFKFIQIDSIKAVVKVMFYKKMGDAYPALTITYENRFRSGNKSGSMTEAKFYIETGDFTIS